MLIFATSNYGTSAGLVLLLLIAWAIVILIILGGIVAGMKMVKRGSSASKKTGVILVLASGMVPCCCYFGPPNAIRMGYGNYPVGRHADDKVKNGMTKDEVRAILGTPHEQSEEGWRYWMDSYGINVLVVHFDDQGRVDYTSYF